MQFVSSFESDSRKKMSAYNERVLLTRETMLFCLLGMRARGVFDRDADVFAGRWVGGGGQGGRNTRITKFISPFRFRRRLLYVINSCKNSVMCIVRERKYFAFY